jgi:hypothetical protein
MLYGVPLFPFPFYGDVGDRRRLAQVMFEGHPFASLGESSSLLARPRPFLRKDTVSPIDFACAGSRVLSLTWAV